MLGIAALLLLGGVVTWLAWPRHPGGDPGGRILSQLKSVSAAVPANSFVQYAHYDEPRWDSCDGMTGTFGWDDPSVQINFTWSGSPTALISGVKRVLAESGWGAFMPQVNNGVPGAAWKKTLDNGTIAQAQLAAESYGGWSLFAQAPPVGQRVSGC